MVCSIIFATTITITPFAPSAIVWFTFFSGWIHTQIFAINIFTRIFCNNIGTITATTFASTSTAAVAFRAFAFAGFFRGFRIFSADSFFRLENRFYITLAFRAFRAFWTLTAWWAA